MPFTFSHPALIFPIYKLREKWFSLSGLIIGSITPDFEYFFRMKKGISNYSHTKASILYFNLPLALLLIFIFHAIIRKQLINHLPPFLYKRFLSYHNVEWKILFNKKLSILIISCLLGSVSHIAWDWLTHYIADFLYIAQDEVFFLESWVHHSIIYSILHLIFSLIGIAVLAIVVLQLPVDRGAVRNNINYTFWIFLIDITFLICIIRFVFCIQFQIEDLAVSFVSAFLLSLIFTCWYLQIINNK